MRPPDMNDGSALLTQWKKAGLRSREAVIVEGLLAATADVLRRMKDDFDRKLAELEQHKGIAYRGIYSAEETYSEGDYVTHAGGLWHANETTRSRPGSDQSFQLCVKRGRA